jgi:CheY-like chemotaxis protein
MTTELAALVVDDDPDCRAMIALMGTIWGTPVLEAGNCAEALAVLEHERERVRLILLDYFMPGMQPAECAAALSAKAGPSIPIVLITAAVDPALRAAELNLTQWVSKPFDIFAIQSLFRKVIENRSAA